MNEHSLIKRWNKFAEIVIIILIITIYLLRNTDNVLSYQTNS